MRYRAVPGLRPGGTGSLPGPERWLFGLASSYEMWPPDRYTFRLPPCALPLYASHEEHRAVSSGFVPGDIGVARMFAEVEGLGLCVLAEVSGDHPGILWDLAEGRRNGLSV
ncbi:MAG TPA: hypothetical protein VEH31_17455 [Streptosporangiaceae bacterium]|nr:hypothetical protein [Streptosporangiaceae bacterium]